MENETFKTLVSWSSGKDSVYALFSYLNQTKTSKAELLLFTTISDLYQRVNLHGLRKVF